MAYLGLPLGHLLLLALGLQTLKYLLSGPLGENLTGPWCAFIGLAETVEDSVSKWETLCATTDQLISLVF